MGGVCPLDVTAVHGPSSHDFSRQYTTTRNETVYYVTGKMPNWIPLSLVPTVLPKDGLGTQAAVGGVTERAGFLEL